MQRTARAAGELPKDELLEIELFGIPQLRFGSAVLPFKGPPRALLLLAYLLVYRRELPRKSVAFALWPDCDEEAGLANLRRHLQLLEAALPPGYAWLRRGRTSVQWSPGAPCRCDVAEFEELAGDPTQHERAAGCYTGDFLQTADDEWVVAVRERLRAQQLQLLSELVGCAQREGRGARALEFARRAFALDPWSEEILREIVRLRAARGDRAGALEECRAFATRHVAEYGVEPSAETLALVTEIGGSASGARLEAEAAPSWRAGSPFVGLRAFDAAHAPVFFGRSDDCARVLGKLESCRQRGNAFVLLVGASGSGKSSLVRAGVVPRLTEAGPGSPLWRICYLTPAGAQGEPLRRLAERLVDESALPELLDAGIGPAELAAALAAGAGADLIAQALRVASERMSPRGRPAREVRLLIVVDQLEELLHEDRLDLTQAKAFVAVLRRLSTSVASVIATLRSDFYPFVAEIEGLADAAHDDGIFALSAVRPESLAGVIRLPAARAGLEFEADPQADIDLADTLQSAAGSSGSLPLLQFVLDELYRIDVEGRGGRALRRATYDALGGLAGAIARRASAVCERFEPQALRATLLELIALREGGAPMARTALETDFTDARQRRIVDALVEERLLTAFDEGGVRAVRLAHEALLTHWSFAAELIVHESNLLRVLNRVRAAHHLYREHGREPAYLLPAGRPLEEAKELQSEWPHISGDLEAFVRDSQARADAAESEARRRETERARLLAESRSARRTALVVAVAALAIVALGLWAFRQSRELTALRERTQLADELMAESYPTAAKRCLADRNRCEASVAGWLNENVPRVSTITSAFVNFDYTVPQFDVRDCHISFTKQFQVRRTGAITRDVESGPLTDIESTFVDKRGFDGGGTEPMYLTVIVESYKWFERAGAKPSKYIYFNTELPRDANNIERHLRLLALLCNGGRQVYTPSGSGTTSDLKP